MYCALGHAFDVVFHFFPRMAEVTRNPTDRQIKKFILFILFEKNRITLQYNLMRVFLSFTQLQLVILIDTYRHVNSDENPAFKINRMLKSKRVFALPVLFVCGLRGKHIVSHVC